MLSHSQEFEEASALVGVPINRTDDIERTKILDKVYKLYTEEGLYSYPLWESLSEWIGIDFRFSWEWFSTILKDKEVYFFFDAADSKEMFSLKGDMIPEILNHCYRFTFYILDKDFTFIICYNDHDNLIASGTAIEFLTSYVVANHSNLKIYKKK